MILIACNIYNVNMFTVFNVVLHLRNTTHMCVEIRVFGDIYAFKYDIRVL